MKLCIPTDSDRGWDAVVADHFGTAPFFTMVDIGTDEIRAVQNPACGHHPGECHHLDILRAHHVQALACTGIGRRALEAVERAGIAVLTAHRPSVREITEAVRTGDVDPRTIEGVGEGGHGGRGRHRHRHRHGQGHDRTR